MKNIEEKVLAARQDPAILEEFIKGYEPFILSCAAKTAKRHISKNDDEWSIALIAFNEAVEGYDPEKGNFLSYCKLIIRSRLIDYFRQQNKHSGQVSLEALENKDLPSNETDTSIKEEIDALSQVVQNIGFSLYELADCSPKAQKTRQACKRIVRYILSSPIILTTIRSDKRLPVKLIEKNTQLPRKIIERHRKYILTAVEILDGEYSYLSEYLAYLREDEEK